jgi:RHS repeat-associated protein
VTPEGTTLYFDPFGVHVEYFSASTSQWNEYLVAGGQMVGVRFERSDSTVATRYFHPDHLGSVAVITEETGAVAERLSYDAWGKRRFPNGADDPAGSITSQTTVGFTGQEELADVGLVHLNGRVYDPVIGRMMSADPYVPDPTNGQAWNRYSYVINNPLAFTDPNGYCFLGLCSVWNSIGTFVDRAVGSFIRSHPIVGTIIEIGGAAICSALGCGPFYAAAVAALSAGAVVGITTGKLDLALKAGLIAGVTAFANFEVGEYTAAGSLGNIAGHAAVGCASAEASGAACGPSALAGAITSAAGPLINNQNGFSVASLVENSVLGGVAAVAGGGKFENGAITGAFGYLFNSQFHSHTAVPFVDDAGNPVYDFYGNPMQRPSDVPPSFFVDAGRAAVTNDAFSDSPRSGSLAGLLNFGQGGPWDVQRVGSDRAPTPAFVDYATVGIGLYGAATGIPAREMLAVEHAYAAQFSNFGNAQPDSTYTHLPARNVFNTNLGYQLYQSGRIGPSP